MMKIGRVFWELICDGIATQVSFGDIARFSSEYLHSWELRMGFCFYFGKTRLVVGIKAKQFIGLLWT
jgi:hypothetical protein